MWLKPGVGSDSSHNGYSVSLPSLLLACLHGVWARGRLPLAQGKRYAGCPSLGFCLFSLSLSLTLSLSSFERVMEEGATSLSLSLSLPPPTLVYRSVNR